MERQRDKEGRAPSWDRALNEHNQVFTCCSREGCQDASKHHVGRLGGIHRRMDPSLAVVGDQGRGLRVIGLQAGFQGCFVIVRTADQGLSSDLGEARGQSPASCSLARSPHLCAAMTTPAPLLQDRLQCGAAEAIPRSAGESGTNSEQLKEVPEQSLKREGFSIVVFPLRTTLLAKRSPRSLESRHQLQLLPRRETSHNPPHLQLWTESNKFRGWQSPGRLCGITMPFTHPSRPRSPQCSGCPGSSPRSPESQDRRYERRKEKSFSRVAEKHQLNPKQRKLRPGELTYIVLHVLFRGSELLVIRAATRWVNQPKTESKCQQSSPALGQGLLNLPLISTETSATAT